MMQNKINLGKKIEKVTTIALVRFAAFLIGTIFLNHKNDHNTPGTFDDSAWEIPAFRVMSDLDTTEIDIKIKQYFDNIISNSSEYKNLSNEQYKVRLHDMCQYYDDICSRIVLQSKFSFREIYNFTVFSIYLITEVDNNIQLEEVAGIRPTLSWLLFTKDDEDITRGKAGHRNVLINTYDMKGVLELFEIMVHEIAGHVLDLGVLHDHDSEHKSADYKEFGKESFGQNDWSLRFYSISRESENKKRNSARDSNMISGYGQTNIYEEFAEFANAWINHHSVLLELARNDHVIRQKYFLFQELFGKWYIHSDIDNFQDLELDKRPYDTTRRESTLQSIEQ